jgi:hypothetical protein
MCLELTLLTLTALTPTAPGNLKNLSVRVRPDTVDGAATGVWQTVNATYVINKKVTKAFIL